MDIAIITTLLGLLVVLLSYLGLKKMSEVSPTILLGHIHGETYKEQTRVILDRILENEDLFDLVCEDHTPFTGHEFIDCLNINTSKFAKFTVEHSTLPIQLTSAERYLRTFKNDHYQRNLKVAVNEQ